MYFFVVILIAVLPVALVLASVYTLVKIGRKFWPPRVTKARITRWHKPESDSVEIGALPEVEYQDEEDGLQKKVMERAWVYVFFPKKKAIKTTILLRKNGEAELLISVLMRALVLLGLVIIGVVSAVLVYRHLLGAKIF